MEHIDFKKIVITSNVSGTFFRNVLQDCVNYPRNFISVCVSKNVGLFLQIYLTDVIKIFRRQGVRIFFTESLRKLMIANLQGEYAN